MRSAAQLVQLLDPPPPPPAQALTQCPPALPPARPHSGHGSIPLPVTQVCRPTRMHNSHSKASFGQGARSTSTQGEELSGLKDC